MRWVGLSLASAFLAVAQSDEIRVSAHDYAPLQLRLTAQAQLVQLEVVVRDPHGQPVGGLKQSDFEILDEGKPRAMAAFSAETVEPAPASANSQPNSQPAAPGLAAPPQSTQQSAPRSTLLFFDDLHGATAELQRTQLAAQRFLKDGLGPGGRAAVFAASQGLVLNFTSDLDALTAAIRKLRPHPRISENGMQSCPRITPYQAYLIEFNLDASAFNAAIQEAAHCTAKDPNGSGDLVADHNAMDPNAIAVRSQASATWEQAQRDSLNAFVALNQSLALLAGAPGTRVLLMASTGFLSGRLEAELGATIDRAVHAGIAINALDAKGVWAELPGRPFDQGHNAGFAQATFMFETASMMSRNDAMNAAMAQLAAGTGGLFFHGSNDLVGGFSQLAAVPETAYLLAFRPDTEGGEGKYHKLKVRLTEGKGYYVQVRPGYFAPGNAPASTRTAQRPLDRKALTSDVLTQFPIQLDSRLGFSASGDTEVSLAIHVDVSPLKFAKRNGRNVQKLTFIGALLDAGGSIVAAKEGLVNFALKNETLPRLTASGLNANLSLTAPPGPYRVRLVVQDADGKMASLNQSVEIPK